MINIKLSKRLSKVADFVDINSSIIDIGCDHALLDIYLIKNRLVKSAIACDIKEGAISIARKNINLYNADKIDLRLGDGLSVLKNDDYIDTVVISGLGNITIINILKDNIDKLAIVNNIIIQSNTNIQNIRKELQRLGYYISNEALVKENNIIYTIIKFTKGKVKYSNKELLFGPILLKNKDDLFKEQIMEIIIKNNHVISKLPNKKFIKKIKLKLYNKTLKKEISK